MVSRTRPHPCASAHALHFKALGLTWSRQSEKPNHQTPNRTVSLSLNNQTGRLDTHPASKALAATSVRTRPSDFGVVLSRTAHLSSSAMKSPRSRHCGRHEAVLTPEARGPSPAAQLDSMEWPTRMSRPRLCKQNARNLSPIWPWT